MWLKQNGDPSHCLTGEVFELKQKQICENNIGKTVETFYFLNILFNFNTQLIPIRWEVLITHPTLAKFWVENKCTKLFYQNRDGEGSLFIYPFKILSFPKYMFLLYSLEHGDYIGSPAFKKGDKRGSTMKKSEWSVNKRWNCKKIYSRSRNSKALSVILIIKIAKYSLLWF